jgi:hypothetical protein
MTAPKPLTFSAAVMNYNHGDVIGNALEAIIRQTRPFNEIIVIDDASTDDSVARIEALIKGVPNARLIRAEKNTGVNGAANRILAELKSDFVFFVASDDRYSPRVLENAERILKDHPGVGMISGNSRTLDTRTGQERPFILPFPQVPAAYSGAELLPVAKRQAFTFFGGANVIRAEAMRAIGGFRENLHWHADWLVYLLLARRHGFGVVPEEFCRFSLSASQYSQSCHVWERQRPVIEALLRTLKREFPEEYPFFKQGALLPVYSIRVLPLLLFSPEFRDYLTPLLAWRLLTYRPIRTCSLLFPVGLKRRLRQWLRV